jgi:hypothetical protein
MSEHVLECSLGGVSTNCSCEQQQCCIEHQENSDHQQLHNNEFDEIIEKLGIMLMSRSSAANMTPDVEKIINGGKSATTLFESPPTPQINVTRPGSDETDPFFFEFPCMTTSGEGDTAAVLLYGSHSAPSSLDNNGNSACAAVNKTVQLLPFHDQQQPDLLCRRGLAMRQQHRYHTRNSGISSKPSPNNNYLSVQQNVGRHAKSESSILEALDTRASNAQQQLRTPFTKRFIHRINNSELFVCLDFRIFHVIH